LHKGRRGRKANDYVVFFRATLRGNFPYYGGLGVESRDVGVAMSLLGAIGVVLQAAIYPMLNDRYGTIKICRSALVIFPVVYLLAPFP